MPLSIRVLFYLLVVTSALLSGCAEVKLGTIPTPALGSNPRIYIQPVSTQYSNNSTAFVGASFPVSHELFARKQHDTLRPVMAAAGYDVVDPLDVKTVLGTDAPNMVVLRPGEDWTPMIKSARALHADYVLVIERAVEAVSTVTVEYRFKVALVNVATGTIYEKKNSEAVGRDDLRYFEEDSNKRANQILDELYKRLFLEAKDETFALAVVNNLKHFKKNIYSDQRMAVKPDPALPAKVPATASSPSGSQGLGEKAELERISAERARMAELKRQMSEQAVALQREKEEMNLAIKAAEQTMTSLRAEKLAREKADQLRASTELAQLEEKNRDAAAEAEAARLRAEQTAAARKGAEQSLKSLKKEIKVPVFSGIKIFDREGGDITDRAVSSQVIVSGQVEDGLGVAVVFVNGTEAFIDEKGAFSATALLKIGVNEVLMEAYNTQQGKSEKRITITRDKAPPASASADISVVPDFRSRPRLNDYAVVIGIEQYRHIPPAEFASRDAALVKDYLKAAGIPERNIAFLADGQATLSDLKKTLEKWLMNHVNKESRVIVYFSGHGAPATDNGDAYLVPFEGDPNYLEDTAYPVKRLYEKLGKLPARQVTVLLDSCFSGAGGRSVLPTGARPLVMARESFTIPANVAVLTAARESQISTTSPERKHGLFTYYFLRALKQGKENLPDIYQYLKGRVEDEARSMNVQQSPSMMPEKLTTTAEFSLL